MRYLGGRGGIRLMALKVIALAIHDGDFEWSQTNDFSMFCALAEQDEGDARLRVFRSMQALRENKRRLKALRSETK